MFPLKSSVLLILLYYRCFRKALRRRRYDTFFGVKQTVEPLVTMDASGVLEASDHPTDI